MVEAVLVLIVKRARERGELLRLSQNEILLPMRKFLLTNPHTLLQITPSRVTSQWFKQRLKLQENKKQTPIFKSLFQPFESFVFIIQTSIDHGQIPAIRLLIRVSFFQLFNYRVSVTSPSHSGINMA